jgi:hypothetical protein
MTEGPSETTISTDDVESLAGKLGPFIDELSEQEQQVLGWILVRAKAAGASVPSEELPTAINTGLAQAAGLEEAPGLGLRGSEITVAWKHSF